jgi:hypothetical protein
VKECSFCPSEYSVSLLDPQALPPEVVLLWNRVLVQSLRPSKYHRYWFGDPALPLVLTSAVRFSFSGLLPATVQVTGRALSSNFTFL